MPNPRYRTRALQRRQRVVKVTAWAMVVALALTGLGALIALQLR